MKPKSRRVDNASFFVPEFVFLRIDSSFDKQEVANAILEVFVSTEIALNARILLPSFCGFGNIVHLRHNSKIVIFLNCLQIKNKKT